MKTAGKPKEGAGPGQHTTLSYLKSLVEMAEKPLGDVPKIGEKLKSICIPARKIVDDVESIKEARELEEKVAERVCRVISAIAQSKARFSAVEIIEKEVTALLLILKGVSTFIRERAQDAHLRALKEADNKKVKNAKQKTEPVISDEVKRQKEKANQFINEINDYIANSALNIKNVLLPANNLTVNVGTKRARDENDGDHKEVEEPTPKRLEKDASPSKSSEEEKEPATPEKAPSTPPPGEKINRSQTGPTELPSSKDAELPVESTLKTKSFTFSNEKEYLQGSPKSSEKDLDSSSETSSPLLKRKWSDDSDQTASSDNSPVSEKAGYARKLAKIPNMFKKSKKV